MIYLHKILPIFLLPTGLAMLLIASGLFLHRRVLCWIGIGLLWFYSTPVVSTTLMRAIEGWQVRVPVQEMPQARAIVVLSSSLTTPPGDTLSIEWTSGAVNRFEAGIALYKAGKAPVLVFTGGWAPWRPTARPIGQVLFERAQTLGIPPADMMVTGKVDNTAAEARAVARLLRDIDNADRPVILVTSAFHMRRARLLFERAGVPVVAFPVDFQVSEDRTFTILDILPGAESLRRTEAALREGYGWLFYAVRGEGAFARWNGNLKMG